MLGRGGFAVAAIREAEQAAFAELNTDPAEEARYGSVLMQRAASGLARVVVDELRSRAGGVYGSTVVAAVGGGNNGGDGLFALAELARRGVRALAWRTSSGVHEAGWAAFRAAGGRQIDAIGALEWLVSADLVLDAVFGIGGRAGLPDDVATFAAACRDLDVPVVAVDLPSGLAADDARPEAESFWAATTVAMGAAKICEIVEPARSRCGRVVVVPIGLPLGAPAVEVFTLAELCALLPVPTATSDKYSRGAVGVDTGSPLYIGAGILSATGAVHGGAGMVRFCGAKPGPVRLAEPSIVVGEGRVEAWLLGSGWGQRPDAAERIEGVLAQGVPTVLDADALRPEVLPQRLRSDVLITPHAGELARLLGRERSDVEARPLRAVADVVAALGATVLLKGATQYVAGPSFPVTIAIPGPGWTAQAGSGDVLAGVCAAMLGSGLAPAHAALCAASLQALAADRRRGPHSPVETAREIPDLIADLVG